MTSLNSTQITIHPEPERNLSPYQQKQGTGAPDIVNNDFFGEGGISFKSLVDAINPLQQLPIISTAYRELTGATISAGSRLMGGALFGGGIGLLAAIVNEISSEATGKDIGGNLYAAVTNQYSATEKLA